MLHIALIHRKANEGRLLEPVSFKFTFRPGIVTVAEEMVEDVPGFIAELPLSEQLFQSIQVYGSQTAKDLAALTNLNLGSIQVILSRDGRFKRVGNNKWDVVSGELT